MKKLLMFILLISCIIDDNNDIDYTYEVSLNHSIEVDSIETILSINGNENSSEIFEKDVFIIKFTANKNSDIKIRYNVYDDDSIIFTDVDSFNLKNIKINTSSMKEIYFDTVSYFDTNIVFDTSFVDDTTKIIDTNIIIDTLVNVVKDTIINTKFDTTVIDTEINIIITDTNITTTFDTIVIDTQITIIIKDTTRTDTVISDTIIVDTTILNIIVVDTTIQDTTILNTITVDTTILSNTNIGLFVDSRDNTIYKKVQIGGQTWMGENLNYVTGSCYLGLTDNCLIHGKLYTWDEALLSCPTGWHLPSSVEWNILINSVGSSGNSLKSTNWNGVNYFGFNILPSGNFILGEGYQNLNIRTGFWNSDEFNKNRGNYISLDASDVIRENSDAKNSKYSIRCVLN